jgi:hypothetical protein
VIINPPLYPEDVSVYLLSLDIYIDKKLRYWLKGKLGFAAPFARVSLRLPPLDEYPETVWPLDKTGVLKPTRKRFLGIWMISSSEHSCHRLLRQQTGQMPYDQDLNDCIYREN